LLFKGAGCRDIYFKNNCLGEFMICEYLYYSFKSLAFDPPPRNMSFIFEQQQWKIQKESKGNKNIFIFLILNIKKLD
jgi:hypothetical protein